MLICSIDSVDTTYVFDNRDSGFQGKANEFPQHAVLTAKQTKRTETPLMSRCIFASDPLFRDFCYDSFCFFVVLVTQHSPAGLL
jgi:hypothetical protein